VLNLLYSTLLSLPLPQFKQNINVIQNTCLFGIKLDYIKKKRKKKKEIPGRDDFFLEGEGLNSKHRTHEILCMVYCVLSDSIWCVEMNIHIH